MQCGGLDELWRDALDTGPMTDVDTRKWIATVQTVDHPRVDGEVLTEGSTPLHRTRFLLVNKLPLKWRSSGCRQLST